MIFGKLINKMSSKANKTIYQQLEGTFNSVLDNYDAEAGNLLQSLLDKMDDVIGILEPIATLLEPFNVLTDIFQQQFTTDLSDELSNLFTVVLTPTTIAKITTLATNLGNLFKLIFNQNTINIIGETTTNFLKLLKDPVPYILERTGIIWEQWVAYWQQIGQYDPGLWGAW